MIIEYWKSKSRFNEDSFLNLIWILSLHDVKNKKKIHRPISGTSIELVYN